jgi:hypothetical protein
MLDIDEMVDLAQQKGWRVKVGDSHKQLFSPDGKKIVTVAGTPSDHRALMNIRAEFKRAGLDMDTGPKKQRTPAGQIDRTLREILSERPDHVFTTRELTEALKRTCPGIADSNVSTHVGRLIEEGCVIKAGYAQYRWRNISPDIPPVSAIPVVSAASLKNFAPSSGQSSPEGMDADMVRFNELADQLVSVVTQMQEVMGRSRGILSQIAALRAALLPALPVSGAPTGGMTIVVSERAPS